MEEYLIKFVKWTKLKIRLHIKPEDKIYFREREVWWASLGVNIGFEQDGKHAQVERPILILRKFGGKTLWVLPMTSKGKTGKFYHQFDYKDKKYSVILSQLRLISSKRLLRKIRTFPKKDFNEVKRRIKSLI